MKKLQQFEWFFLVLRCHHGAEKTGIWYCIFPRISQLAYESIPFSEPQNLDFRLDYAYKSTPFHPSFKISANTIRRWNAYLGISKFHKRVLKNLAWNLQLRFKARSHVIVSGNSGGGHLLWGFPRGFPSVWCHPSGTTDCLRTLNKLIDCG